MRMRWWLLALAAVISTGTAAEKKYGPGVSDTEIKLGQTVPYSGPVSAYGTIGKSEAAYFEMLNHQGGVNGRKIRLISIDDGYSPPRTVEQTRRLVEEENVLAIFSPVGTPTSSATHKYLNAKRVPQILIQSAANKWNDPGNFPWSMSWSPNAHSETHVFGKYLLQAKPQAKIAVLYQNDDFGKDLLNGLKSGLGAKAAQMIVSEVSYEVSDPTVDQQVIAIKASGADVFVSFAAGKLGAQAIRKTRDMGWKPAYIVPIGGSGTHTVLEPAGLANAVGIVTGSWLKDPGDPQWAHDAAVKDYLAFMKKYYPEADAAEVFNVNGYSIGQVMIEVLRRCRDDLTART